MHSLQILILSIAISNTVGSPCIPSVGKTALVIGQDYDSINSYSITLGHEPFGVMSYTALNSSTGKVQGLDLAIDYGSGTEWAAGSLRAHPGSSLQLGLWLVDSCESIVTGELDREIFNLGKFILNVRVPVYLRIGYEFDLQGNRYTPEQYVMAFHYIVDTFRAREIKNVAFVWHSWGGLPRDNIPFQLWFPGKTYVDWCGISLFEQPYECDPFEPDCTLPHIDAMANFCRDLNIPMMIAESTPFGGIVNGSGGAGGNEAGYRGDSWTRWFIPVLGIIEKYDIRMWSYINCDWDALPMWAVNHAPGVHWGDSRIEAYADVRTLWEEQVLSSSRFHWSTKPNSSQSYECTNVFVSSPRDQWSLATLCAAASVFALAIAACMYSGVCEGQGQGQGKREGEGEGPTHDENPGVGACGHLWAWAWAWPSPAGDRDREGLELPQHKYTSL